MVPCYGDSKPVCVLNNKIPPERHSPLKGDSNSKPTGVCPLRGDSKPVSVLINKIPPERHGPLLWGFEAGVCFKQQNTPGETQSPERGFELPTNWRLSPPRGFEASVWSPNNKIPPERFELPTNWFEARYSVH